MFNSLLLCSQADIKPQHDGANGLKYNLTADIIQSIFKTYPMGESRVISLFSSVVIYCAVSFSILEKFKIVWCNSFLSFGESVHLCPGIYEVQDETCHHLMTVTELNICICQSVKWLLTFAHISAINWQTKSDLVPQKPDKMFNTVVVFIKKKKKFHVHFLNE